MNKIIILTGGNLGDRYKNLAKAAALIKKEIGKISHRSAIYETAAWGKTDQSDFLNQVLIVHSRLAAQEVMKKILAIEKKLGRSRDRKWEPRTIDIDILFFNKEIINRKNLSIPHPEIQNRNFALAPLNELIPAFKHPVINKSIHEIFLNCKDKLPVKKIKPENGFHGLE